MRVDVSVVFAPADRPAAERLATHLELAAQARVWLEEVSAPVSETWDQGMSSAGVIILLSPDSVPARSSRTDWEELLAHTGTPPVARLLVQPCRYPPLLERNLFFRWSDTDILRQLHRWVIGLFREERRPPGAAHCQDRDDDLWKELVDRPGTMRIDSAAQAKQFIHDSNGFFRDVLTPPGGLSLPMLLGQIASALNIGLRGTVEEACEQVATALADVRLLLLLSGMQGDAPFLTKGLTSVLYAPDETGREMPAVHTMTQLFLQRATRSAECAEYVPYVEAAIEGFEWPVAKRLGRAAFSFLRDEQRLFEAAHIATVLRQRAQTKADRETEDWAREELSWIVGGERVLAAAASGEQLSLLFM